MANTKHPQPCGTAAAARRHRYHGEPPCDACAEAERADGREQYQSESPAARERRRQQNREYYLEVELPRREARKAAREPQVLKRDLPCLEDCGKLVGRTGSRGRCQRCNQRIARAELKAEQRPCAIATCPGFVRALGQPHCDMHRSRVRRGGEAGLAEPLIGPRGEWRLDKKGYRMQVIDGHVVLEHRLVMEQLLGREMTRSESVHHVSGQRDDNRTDGPLVNFRSGNLELWSSWQPSGQRVADKVEFAVELLREYAPDLLAEPVPGQIAS